MIRLLQTPLRHLKIVLTCCEYRRFLEQMQQLSKEVPGPGMYEPQHQNARIRGGKISLTSSLTHWQILDKHGNVCFACVLYIFLLLDEL
jgi:hypothetical protein